MVEHIYKIHGFDEVFSLQAIVITAKSVFLLFPSQPLLGKQFFHIFFISSSILRVLLNVELFQRKTHGCFNKRMSVIKNFRDITCLQNPWCNEVLQENVFDEALFKKISYLKKLPINNQNLVLVKEFIFW